MSSGEKEDLLANWTLGETADEVRALLLSASVCSLRPAVVIQRASKPSSSNQSHE
jgi:hypothetical protein